MLFMEYPQIVDPRLNLAIEEYLLRHSDVREPILFLYINSAAVIIGRNQNVYEEVNLQYCREQETPVLRRLSGGGTVYHDRGNLNYSLISPNQSLLNDYARFTRPVILALDKLGVTAELRLRSSIFVGERKISGNAQSAARGRLVSHGTLLFDCALDQMRQAIAPGNDMIYSRAVQSIRSPVINLSEVLASGTDVPAIKSELKQRFAPAGFNGTYRLLEDDWKKVNAIVEQRYRTWEWNIGRSPKSTIVRCSPMHSRSVKLLISIDRGLVQQVDAGNRDPMSEEAAGLLKFLDGVRYDSEALSKALNANQASIVQSGFSVEHLLELVKPI